MNPTRIERWILLRDSGELGPVRTWLLERQLAHNPEGRAFAAALRAGRSALHAETFAPADDGLVRTLIAAARQSSAPRAQPAFAWRPAFAIAAAALAIAGTFWWTGRAPLEAPPLARGVSVETPSWDGDLDDDLEAIDAILLSSVDEDSANHVAALPDEDALLREWLELNEVEI